MDIFSSSGNPWRTPHEARPLVVARRAPRGAYEIVIRPGGDVADLAAVLTALPHDAIFTWHYGDPEAVLVFQPIPPADVAALLSGAPAAPAPGVSATP